MCERPATRVGQDEYGININLCSRCPTIEEIYDLAEQLRKRWTLERKREAERERRAAVEVMRV